MKKGFTLIEFMLYIAIVGVMLAVTAGSSLQILLNREKLAVIEEVSHNARFSLEKIIATVRNAQAINSPAPAASASSLSLQMANAALNPTVFDLSGGVIRITEGAGSAVDLTTNEVTISTLLFSNISYGSTPGTVRIQITAEATNPGSRPEHDFSETFYATANIYQKP
jgi:prepilin-type N-terminal cleavage/methylation domain-containing protein